MDTKQLITGNPKEGFYPIVQDTVTVIELNEAVMNLTSESSSEDIAAAFDSAESFNGLIEQIRNTENIVNGILMNNDGSVGKIICTIAAYKNQYACDIEYFYDGKIIRLDVTNTDGTMSCTRKETALGGDSILETEGDGSKFLSNDGSYKEINGIYYIDANENTPKGLEGVKTALANNKLPVFKHLYEGNPAYNLSPAICNFGSDGRLQSYMTFYDDNIIKIDINVSNELNHEQIPIKQVEKVTINAYVGSTIPIEQFEKLQVVDGIKVVLIDDPDEGYYSIPATVKGITDKEIEYIYKGQYNKITIDNSYNVTKETKDLGGDLSNYLAKDNTTEFTPTANYQPATKKYVDDHNSNYPGGILNIGENSVSYDEDIINYGYLVIFLSGFGNIVIPIRVSGGKISEYRTLISVSDSVGVGESAYSLALVTMSNLTKNANKYEGTINVKYLHRIIRESDYNDLGTTPETDDILYFIIPD